MLIRENFGHIRKGSAIFVLEGENVYLDYVCENFGKAGAGRKDFGTLQQSFFS